MKNIIYLILIITPISGIVYCFRYFSKGNLTANEQVLFSIILTIGSFFLSWIVSHFYYEKSHQKSIEEIKKDNQSNLKIYASKAAEKVRNLSAQLVSLITYLNEELNSEEEYDSIVENLHAKEERIYSAIHIVKTLKSINDGSLSDWSGVIPEEIEEIAQEEREKVERISNLINDFDRVKSQQDDFFHIPDDDEKMELLSKKIDLLLGSLTGVSPKPLKSASKKEGVEKNCLECGNIIKYRQKPLSTSRKSIKCTNCGTKLISGWNSDDGFILNKTSTRSVVNESDYNKEYDIDENFVEMIRSKLPPQPWPKKLGKNLSIELKIPRFKIHRAIDVLIKRGIFKYQVNGVLYIPDPDQNLSPSSNEKDPIKSDVDNL